MENKYNGMTEKLLERGLELNELRIFNNDDFGEVRIIVEDGKTWFSASDVANKLGYSNSRKSVGDHCRAVTKRYIPHPQSANKKIEMNFINEADLYRLIIGSTLPAAVKFEAWIFEEVLPSIRTNGGYITNQDNMTPEQIVANALVVANNIIRQKDRMLEEQKPKVVFADAVTASKQSILIGELAKLIKQNGIDMGGTRLFAWMRENGYLIKRIGTDYNMPTQKSMELKLFEVKISTSVNSDGSTRENKTSKVTGKGQQYFINKFLAG